MPNDSWLPNVDAPLMSVTVSFPALIRSGSCFCVSLSLVYTKMSCAYLLSWLGVPSHTQNAVLRLEYDFSALGQESRCCKRHANTKVDVHAVLELLCCALDDTLTFL